MTQGHRGVTRIAQILENVSRSEHGMTLAEVTKQLQAPKSSVYELLNGLVGVGYLVHGDGAYRLGPALVGVVSRFRMDDWFDFAESRLEKLTASTGETSLLGVRAGRHVMYVRQMESDALIRYVAPLRTRRPLVRTAMGKAILSRLPENEVRSLVASSKDRQAIVLDDYLRELATARNRGFALNRGETVVDVYAVASPVVGGADLPIGAISVVGPKARVEGRMDEFGEMAREVAEEMSSVDLS